MTAQRPLVVVGDALLDQDLDGEATRLAPDAPAPVVDVVADRTRPGGAGLAAVLAARHGREVVLVTALGGDPASAAVRAALEPRVRLVELPLDGSLPVKTRVRAGGRPLVRVDRGGGTPGPPGGAAGTVLREACAVLVSDYGRGTAAALRPLLAEAARGRPFVWDPHPRGAHPVPGVRLATPNAAEARAWSAPDRVAAEDDSLRAHGVRGARLAERWRAAAVTITLGGRGAILTRAGSGDPMYLPAPYAADGDPCGAGDCFAVTAVTALADGGLPEEAVQRAVAEATAFVAAGGADDAALWDGAPRDGHRGNGHRGNADEWGGDGWGGLAGRADGAGDPPPADALHRLPLGGALCLAESVRARGGTVVATGGCFDLLHAGHVGLLQNARRTGDCLIVCVNSDASVRRLKGPGRPITPLADRVRVLAGLGCVDAVAVFHEDTPEAVLRVLRPDVWVKGGDYSVDALPETAVLREWGGQALVLPYLDGRSTTELARRAARAPARPRP
ncbi:D-glycero-beta-D-manno-heptose 1-phosphate adenylyltransferase [Streptomyces sp. ME19-01-6]|uniref:D-glycero-beta-D-manno-heptose 1-phosphate adenylyltransferase n=1 Tax=Streptomyces sp. ME19-01-6 TaxID=3028686 RepID=UPI0029A5D83C|nr:D-glycero-beta-D-manno-heptose 1-phosphate adenylyltransferase [Streptomyces sp. ME19-01-6]MDX3233136.1 D-glycero-beta-D-manno-heptose 1-phosphate adenylyltransferase [Streptomyces sp. ME19-01-6]